MKLVFLALTSVLANSTTGDYQLCTSDIVCEEGSKCVTATQSDKPTTKICAPWHACIYYMKKDVIVKKDSKCQDTTPYVINQGLGTYSGWLVSYQNTVLDGSK